MNLNEAYWSSHNTDGKAKAHMKNKHAAADENDSKDLCVRDVKTMLKRFF